MPIVAVGALKYGTLVFEGQCNLDEIIGKMERERERGGGGGGRGGGESITIPLCDA